ncbi:MAG: ribonuclease HIII [Candidatus Cloacimonadaceae bacterium]|nr:ribonuclease HIII [Candidatus Cloacimonadaceae bacterium]MDP3114449.1 ribonuclease HIII [Candidatus Cloacimonadaceae bacterium]
MHKHIEAYLSHLEPILAQNGILVAEGREIAYGYQLRLEDGENRIVLNVYYSDKRGLTAVVGANGANALKPKIETILFSLQETPQDAGFHDWESWIGSDECGKGDYFGPLVVASFYMEKEMEKELRGLGVCDSKRLTDALILKIALQLYERYAANISCVLLKPPKYNEIIADMKTQKKNLNDLLAWQHGKAITELVSKHENVQGILVDQFSSAKKVQKLLVAAKIKAAVIERHGAESDPAVAAASIIARYQFLQNRKSMNRFYGMVLPLGASNSVISAANAFVEKFGISRLGEVAKLHFKTTEKVR